MSNHRSNGFTLIELMIVIAIIVVLASLAVSAYQTFTVRAQISEGLNFAASAKEPIVDAYRNSGVAPANRAAAGMSPLPSDTRGSYVSSVDVVDGRVDITFGGPLAHQDTIGQTISLTPYELDDRSIIWRCGNAQTPSGKRLEAGGAHLSPSLDVRYLPAGCR